MTDRRASVLIDFTAPDALPTISALAGAIKGGSVKTLIVLGGNPAYNAPADLDWPAVQASVGEEQLELGCVRREASC